MGKYEMDSVRWLESQAALYHRMKNFEMEKKFLHVARELEGLKEAVEWFIELNNDDLTIFVYINAEKNVLEMSQLDDPIIELDELRWCAEKEVLKLIKEN